MNAEDRALLAQVATVNAEMGTIVQRLLAHLDDTGGLRADDLRLLAQSLQQLAQACQARAERVDADCLAAVESAHHAGTPCPP